MRSSLADPRSASRLTSRTRNAPVFDPIAAFASAPAEQYRALWLRPASGEAMVGLGCAAALRGDPAAVAHAWRELLAESVSSDEIGPRLLGGFRFDPHTPPTRLWSGFECGRLVLPQRQLTLRAGAAWETTNRLERAPGESSLLSRLAPRVGLAPEAWRSAVSRLARGIGTGELGVRKVVLARTQTVSTKTSLEQILRRLASEYPACTTFAIGVGDAYFLGSSPERLIALQDGAATTVALAGSAPRGRTPEQDRAIGQRLLEDPKERLEHAVVVDALRESLAEVCTRVVAEAEPRLHQLSNVQHLVTPIRAQVEAGRSVLDLVARLHPTPAVGGYPRARALELIREIEELDRGWYAAPLGWVDGRGQGEFVVGLRSAVLRGEQATLFAGCGIVADSDPPTELAESGWKLRPMLSALEVQA